MGVNPNIRRDIITQNSSRIGRTRREEQGCLNSVIKQNEKNVTKKRKNNVTMIVIDSSSESNLDEDSLVEVLVRLPVNIIYKFRTVSKLWFNLLSDTVFINRVVKRFDNKPPWSILFNIGDDQSGFLIVNPTIHTRFFKNHKGFDFKFLLDGLNPLFNQGNLFFIGSSNGLVLCSTLDDQRNYYVCNPLTRKGVLIPQPLNWDKNKEVVHGFTCESSSFTSASYMVFRILPQCPEDLTRMFHIEIFSSDSGEWEVHRVKRPGEILLEPIICSVVVHNGVLYWTEQRLHRIIAYEFIRNYESKIGECRFICLPADRGDDDYHCRRCLCVSQGLVCYVQVQRRRQTLSVWVLQEDSGGECFWILLQKIDLHDIILKKNGKPMNLVMLQAEVDCPRPLAIDPGDHNVVILDCEVLVFAYNIQTRKSELLNCPSSRNKRSVFHSRGEVFPFVMAPRPTPVPSPSWAC